MILQALPWICFFRWLFFRIRGDPWDDSSWNSPPFGEYVFFPTTFSKSKLNKQGNSLFFSTILWRRFMVHFFQAPFPSKKLPTRDISLVMSCHTTSGFNHQRGIWFTTRLTSGRRSLGNPGPMELLGGSLLMSSMNRCKIPGTSYIIPLDCFPIKCLSL